MTMFRNSGVRLVIVWDFALPYSDIFLQLHVSIGAEDERNEPTIRVQRGSPGPAKQEEDREREGQSKWAIIPSGLGTAVAYTPTALPT